MTEPKCKDHPDARLMKARNAGTSTGRWICVVCWKVVGTIEYVEPAKWEKFTIEGNRSKKGPEHE